MEVIQSTYPQFFLFFNPKFLRFLPDTISSLSTLVWLFTFAHILCLVPRHRKRWNKWQNIAKQHSAVGARLIQWKTFWEHLKVQSSAVCLRIHAFVKKIWWGHEHSYKKINYCSLFLAIQLSSFSRGDSYN